MNKIIIFPIILLIMSNIQIYSENMIVEENNNFHTFLNDTINNEDANKIFIQNNDNLDQNQSNNSGNGIFINNEIWYSQSFIPSLEILAKIQIYLSKIGQISNDNIITFIIRESLYRDNIFIKILNTNQILYNGSWIEIKDINIKLNPGNHYYIILKSNFDISNDGIIWHYGLNDPYESGDGYFTENYGISWYKLDNQPQYSGLDFCFKTFGYSNYPPNKPLKPAGRN